MKLALLSSIFLLNAPGMLLGSAGPSHADGIRPETELLDLEHLPVPVLENIVQYLPHKALINLRSTSRIFRRLIEPKLAHLLQTKLTEYWSKHLFYIGLNPEDPQNRQLMLDCWAGYPYCSAAFSPDGTYLATGSACSQFLLWQLQAPVRTASYEDVYTMAKHAKTLRQIKILEYSYCVTYAMALSPNGKMLAGARCGTVFIWNMPEGTLINQYKDKHPISSIAFSPDGKLLAYPQDHIIKLLDVTDPKNPTIKKELQGEPLFAFSHDGSILAYSTDCHTIATWNISSERIEQIGEFNNKFKLTALAFSPENTLALGFQNGRIELWNVQVGRENKELNKTAKLFCDNGDPVDFLAFCRYGGVLASASRNPPLPSQPANKIGLWNMLTGQRISSLNGNGPIAFSPDGLLLAARNHFGFMTLWQHAEKLPK